MLREAMNAGKRAFSFKAAWKPIEPVNKQFAGRIALADLPSKTKQRPFLDKPLPALPSNASQMPASARPDKPVSYILSRLHKPTVALSEKLAGRNNPNESKFKENERSSLNQILRNRPKVVEKKTTVGERVILRERSAKLGLMSKDSFNSMPIADAVKTARGRLSAWSALNGLKEDISKTDTRFGAPGVEAKTIKPVFVGKAMQIDLGAKKAGRVADIGSDISSSNASQANTAKQSVSGANTKDTDTSFPSRVRSSAHNEEGSVDARGLESRPSTGRTR